MTCKCSSLHDVGLKLIPPSQIIIPEDDDQDIIKQLQFYLAISHMIPSQTAPLKEWNEILLKNSEGSKTVMIESFATPSTAFSNKTVGFAVPSFATLTSDTGLPTQSSTIVQSAMVSLTLSTIETISKPTRTQRISNLCEAMQCMRKKKQGDRCGHIEHCYMSQLHKYDVYTVECLGSCDEWSLVPLKQVLQDSSLLYGDKLRQAATSLDDYLQCFADARHTVGY
ncbi:hypothetical protein ACHAPU_009600 [Fusarium lateritium]